MGHDWETFLTDRFQEAVSYAMKQHWNQPRKETKIPYLTHLFSVTALVLEDGGTEEEAIAALLHDAVEDQGGTEARVEIRRRFGDRVTEIVDGCTDAEVIPKPPWKDRKIRYLKHLESASPSIIRVALADKLHNLRSIAADYRQIGDALWGRFNAGRDEQLWFYRSFIEVVRKITRSPMISELERLITDLEQISS